MNYFWAIKIKSSNMKKIFIILALTGLLATMFISCSPSSHCPAYGSIDTEQVDANV